MIMQSLSHGMAYAKRASFKVVLFDTFQTFLAFPFQVSCICIHIVRLNLQTACLTPLTLTLSTRTEGCKCCQTCIYQMLTSAIYIFVMNIDYSWLCLACRSWSASPLTMLQNNKAWKLERGGEHFSKGFLFKSCYVWFDAANELKNNYYMYINVFTY